MKLEKLNLLSKELKQAKVTSFQRFHLQLAHEKLKLGNFGDIRAQPIHNMIKDKKYDLLKESMFNPRLIKLFIKNSVDHILLQDNK